MLPQEVAGDSPATVPDRSLAQAQRSTVALAQIGPWRYRREILRDMKQGHAQGHAQAASTERGADVYVAGGLATIPPKTWEGEAHDCSYKARAVSRSLRKQVDMAFMGVRMASIYRRHPTSYSRAELVGAIGEERGKVDTMLLTCQVVRRQHVMNEIAGGRGRR